MISPVIVPLDRYICYTTDCTHVEHIGSTFAGTIAIDISIDIYHTIRIYAAVIRQLETLPREPAVVSHKCGMSLELASVIFFAKSTYISSVSKKKDLLKKKQPNVSNRTRI